MQAEPGAFQSGHQFRDLPGLQGSVGQNQKRHGHGCRTDPLCLGALLQDNQHHCHAPGKGGGKLKLVGQGNPSGGDATGHQIGAQAAASCQKQPPGNPRNLILSEQHTAKFQNHCCEKQDQRGKKQYIQHFFSSFSISVSNSAESSISIFWGLGPETQ